MSFDKLKGKIREQGMSQAKLAGEIGITAQALNRKLNGKTQFTLGEVVKISDVLLITDPGDIFFDPSVSNMQHH